MHAHHLIILLILIPTSTFSSPEDESPSENFDFISTKSMNVSNGGWPTQGKTHRWHITSQTPVNHLSLKHDASNITFKIKNAEDDTLQWQNLQYIFFQWEVNKHYDRTHEQNLTIHLTTEPQSNEMLPRIINPSEGATVLRQDNCYQLTVPAHSPSSCCIALADNESVLSIKYPVQPSHLSFLVAARKKQTVMDGLSLQYEVDLYPVQVHNSTASSCSQVPEDPSHATAHYDNSYMPSAALCPVGSYPYFLLPSMMNPYSYNPPYYPGISVVNPNFFANYNTGAAGNAYYNTHTNGYPSLYSHTSNKPYVRPPDGKRVRTQFTSQQLSVLETQFKQGQYINSLTRAKLAQQLTLTETNVKIWFQNRRTKHHKNQKKPFG